MMNKLLNEGHPETGKFYGDKSTGSCHWKDVQTSIIRLMTAEHLHLDMYNLDTAYFGMALLRRDGDPATEEVLSLK